MCVEELILPRYDITHIRIDCNQCQEIILVSWDIMHPNEFFYDYKIWTFPPVCAIHAGQMKDPFAERSKTHKIQ